MSPTTCNLQSWARAVGFDDAGVADATYLEEDAAVLDSWLAAGYHGTMDYMARNQHLRTDPRQLVPGCRTLLVCILSYNKSCRQPHDAPYIAKSGLSLNDYHYVVKQKLQQLEARIVAECGSGVFADEYQHLFCDSAPILERRWAVRAGLGFIGKNHLFIHPQLGSYVHIGILALQSEVRGGGIHMQDMVSPCTECDRCLRACPTGALRTDLFDARRCVSYLTIERKEALPAEHEGAPYMNLYGCDCCQMACPINREAPVDLHPELAANPLFLTMTREDWQSLSKRQKLKLLHRLAQ